MKFVSRRTGLSPHTIRVWEKRYGAVIPERTDTNRRLYSDEDIERLLLLKRATLEGHSIGQIARLSITDLKALLGTESEPGLQAPSVLPAAQTASAAEIIEDALAAVHSFDRERLEKVLHHASATFSQPFLIEHILSPLLERLGELWSEGTMRISQEHFSSSVLRGFLSNLTRQIASSPASPVLLVATPAGQHHEFGALFAAAAACSCGWRTLYLGPNLPAEEIAGAAAANRARAVALSIIFPADDMGLTDELILLRRCLPPDTGIIAGGRSASSYRKVLDAIGAVMLADSLALRNHLNALRAPSQ